MTTNSTIFTRIMNKNIFLILLCIGHSVILSKPVFAENHRAVPVVDKKSSDTVSDHAKGLNLPPVKESVNKNISLPYEGTEPYEENGEPMNPSPQSKEPKRIATGQTTISFPYDDETDKTLTLEKRARLLAEWYPKYFYLNGQPRYDNVPSEEDMLSLHPQGGKRRIAPVAFARRFNSFKLWAEEYAKYFYPNGQRRSKSPLPPFFDKSPLDGYIQGKVCDLDGEPIIGFTFHLESSKSDFRTGKYHPPSSNEKGEYQLDIPYTELPAQFKLVEGGDGDSSLPAKPRIHQKIYVKKGETVHLDFMIDEEPRTRPWWHFKYNTGKCDAPWSF